MSGRGEVEGSSKELSILRKVFTCLFWFGSDQKEIRTMNLEQKELQPRCFFKLRWVLRRTAVSKGIS